MADVKFEDLPFDERRHRAHPYVDLNGWCRDCGRAEGWKAHAAIQAPAVIAAPDAVTAPLPPPPIPDESADPSAPSPSKRVPRS